MTELIERFLKYVSFDTQSSEANETQCPSTEKQFRLAEYLCDELKALGPYGHQPRLLGGERKAPHHPELRRE